MGSRIAVVGSSNTDMIMKVDRIPKPGETVIGGRFSTAPGGKGANQAVAAARAGGDVSFVARVGDDMFGRQAIDGFVLNRIDVTHVFQESDEPSGMALIFVDDRGENSIAVASGANARLSPSDVAAARDTIGFADILVLQLENPLETVRAAAELAHEQNIRVILNPAPAQPLGEDILRHISVLTPNETEAEMLTGIPVSSESEAEAAASALFDMGLEAVLITLGPRGAFILDADHRELIPGFLVEAVDTTAAGDVFNGSLAVALAEGKSLAEAARFACAAGALSVTKLGAQPSAPTRTEIEKFLIRRP